MLNVTRLVSAFSDDRGDIFNVLEVPINHVALITSSKGAIRGNHYHSKDSHHTYLISGRALYRQSTGGTSEEHLMAPGDLIFTEAGTPHVFLFLEESVFLALTTEPRGGGRYDEDTHKFDVSSEVPGV